MTMDEYNWMRAELAHQLTKGDITLGEYTKQLTRLWARWLAALR
jgi:hypothetical protein